MWWYISVICMRPVARSINTIDTFRPEAGRLSGVKDGQD